MGCSTDLELTLHLCITTRFTQHECIAPFCEVSLTPTCPRYSTILSPAKDLHSRQYSRQFPSSSQEHDEEDFFRFTSGRWLWNEEERLRSAYRRFDIGALKDIAVAASGAQRCVAMCKLAEGGFNKVFRLTMDDNSTLIARIPNQTSETVSSSLASEVATMDFVSIRDQPTICYLPSLTNKASKILGVPVPDVLSWDDDTSNPVRSEYVLMSEARGTPLHSN